MMYCMHYFLKLPEVILKSDFNFNHTRFCMFKIWFPTQYYLWILKNLFDHQQCSQCHTGCNHNLLIFSNSTSVVLWLLPDTMKITKIQIFVFCNNKRYVFVHDSRPEQSCRPWKENLGSGPLLCMAVILVLLGKLLMFIYTIICWIFYTLKQPTEIIIMIRDIFKYIELMLNVTGPMTKWFQAEIFRQSETIINH